jgi:predicted O-methyltransferase YrrM
MYSPFQLAIKYLRYLLSASSGKGHGVHSPFVFEFITKVLNGKKDNAFYNSIEGIRRQLLRSDDVLTVEDFGAGSRSIATKQRTIKQVARTSLKPKKYSQLLHRAVRFYKPATIHEIGTSLGITTSYIASGNLAANVITMEGAREIATVAAQNFQSLHLNNIRPVQGNFDQTLASTLANVPSVDFAFIDGNHRYEPTVRYFQQILEKSGNNTIIILDDIYWSREMEQAWKWVKTHPQVRLTIDLFAIGIVVLRPEILHKQHFCIRY